MPHSTNRLAGRTGLASLLGILAVSVLGASGCAETTGGSNTAAGAPARSGSVEMQLVDADPWLKERLNISVGIARRVEGFLKVQVTLQSRTAETVPFETKFEWFDRDGFKVSDSTESWRPGDAPAGATIEVQGTAPRREAETFRFHVRKANPIS